MTMAAEPVDRDIVPPQDLDAERSVLAAMMLGPEAIAAAREIVDEKAFYRVAHRRMFTAMLAIHDRGERTDSITLAHQLRHDGHLEECGGPAAIAHILEYATTTANTREHAKILRDKQARRAARKIASDFVRAVENPTSDLEEVATLAIEQLGRARDHRTVDARADQLLSQSVTGAQLLAEDLPPIPRLVGNGILVAGGTGIIVGRGGIGKTRLTLQLMRSMATAAPWVNFEVAHGRAGLIEMEMPRVEVQGMIRSLVEGPAAEQFEFLIQPTGMGKLTDQRTADTIARWCEKKKLSLAILDALHHFQGGDEKEAQAADALIERAIWIGQRTGCTILFPHHENKIQPDKRLGLREAVRITMRGSGRLWDSTDTVLGMIEQQGRILLVFAKTRYAPPRDEMAIKMTADGWFVVGETQEQQADRTTEKVEKALLFAGDNGMTMQDLMRVTRLSRSAISEHLQHIDHRRERQGNASRYFLRTEQPAEQEEMGDW